MNSRISSLDPKLRSGLLIFAALLISFALWAAVYLREEPFAALYEDLRGEEAAEISQQLEAWKIPFQVTDQGRRLEISAEAVEPTRLRLLSAGIPSGGRVGFELFKDSDFGVTELAQRVNFQRALQHRRLCVDRAGAGASQPARIRRPDRPHPTQTRFGGDSAARRHPTHRRSGARHSSPGRGHLERRNQRCVRARLCRRTVDPAERWQRSPVARTSARPECGRATPGSAHQRAPGQRVSPWTVPGGGDRGTRP